MYRAPVRLVQGKHNKGTTGVTVIKKKGGGTTPPPDPDSPDRSNPGVAVTPPDDRGTTGN